MSTKLRGAVFGAGNMGRHHIRIMDAHPDVDLVAIVDPDVERAKQHPSAAHTPVFASVEDMPDVDLAIVAIPTQYHLEAGLALMNRGINILIEKPLAGNPEDARTLVDAAKSAGVILATGHVERFNPAVNTLARLIDEPLFISIERLSPYTPRIQDSVVFDLTIHDIDLACWLAGGYPSEIAASGTKVYSDTIDAASSVLKFPNGCVVTLQTSRITNDKIRRISVSEKDRFLVADTLHQSIEVRKQAEVSYKSKNEEITFAQTSVVESLTIDKSGEPLRKELDDFLNAIRTGGKPTVDGEAGLAAVELAHKIEALCL
ncbi:MAG: Gfo/Idh/MocA family oxidoreductase [Coriobacteriia bacterium]|nr:Gfo/Idh/MocA family oxidoreductase [Coriobacteriia bacterium]MCL2746796.1 Gfo/Idh/MocA family oxidoreductase [Coriobacteriia bacterium]MCL2871156.1 Gfo/Idh/MocA family oxidoreductase [Coriobacteriia bacterium]